MNNNLDKSNRLFIATFINQSITNQFYNELTSQLNNCVSGKIVENYNFHFTWHFFGECNLNETNIIKENLKEFFKNYNHSIYLKSISAFPNKNNPKVIFIALESQNYIMKEIHKKLTNEIKNLGYQTDNRSFKPHLTLVRVKEILDRIKLKNFFEKNEQMSFGLMNNFDIVLVKSILTTKGPIYKIIS